MPSRWRSAICVAFVVLVLLNVARYSRFLWRLGCRSQFRRALARLVQRFRGGSRDERQDEMQLLVNKEVMRVRRALMVRLIHVGLGPACGMALSVVIPWLQGSPAYQPVGHILVLGLVFLSMSVYSMFPNVSSSGKMWHLTYACFMMLGMAGIWMAIATPCAVNRASANWLLVRLPISMVYGSVCGLVMWNGLGVLSMCALLPRLAGDPIQGVETKHTVLEQEVLYSAFTVAISIAADRFLKASIRHMLDAKGLTQTNSAMSHLLGLVCDTVVELDSDLCVSKPDSRLAAFLQVEQAHILEGRQFKRWIESGEDQQKFESHLTSARTGENTMPQAFNLVLCDSMQQRLEVEIFSVAFLDLEACPRFFVGIMEASERTAPLAQMKKFDRPPEAKQDRHMRGPGTPPANKLQQLDAAEAEAEGNGGANDKGIRSASADPAASGCPASAIAPGACRASSARSSRSHSSGRLSDAPCYRGLMVTSAVTIQQVAMEALRRLNVPVKATMCCRRHALIHCLRHALEEIHKLGCAEVVRQCRAQCRNCGVLEDLSSDEEEDDHEPWECGVCGNLEVRPIRDVVAL